tara:strand:+ start:11687 stop:12829 length:1143 start_codon:yes stop_codon:yes gene_type:complete
MATKKKATTKKQVNTTPGETPFRKGQGSDESYGIPEDRSNIDDAFDQFQILGKDISQGGLMGNLWADAENKMDIGDNFGGVKTDFSNQSANLTNTFGGLQNQFANNTNQFEGMENTFEDLSVDLEGRSFQQDSLRENQANVLNQLRDVGGTSGGASLAQSLVKSGSDANRQIGADTSRQMQQNQMASASQAGKLQQMAAQGQTNIDTASSQGQAAVDMAKAQGGMQTQLAIAQGGQAANQLSSQAELAAAQGLQNADIATGQGAMEAQKIQLQGAADNRDLMFQTKQGELSFLAGLLNADQANKDSDYKKSDRRLKKNISKIGVSASGINIYSFEYKNPSHGCGLFQGVMSDEVSAVAVRMLDGYDTVNYNMLDIEFKQI